ncbi:lysophospholipid acyltransferase family protein [uncultured Jannaschia sp.]|uniref:lysophospholipid acyltransferase family protein n=1 Tax=uncultured Jannaschia sp. TaxID=293347 RepID=UPI0026330359|nr:lysophospholipid acyltransferase family protein [uncultured Jannaschia sp.]
MRDLVYRLQAYALRGLLACLRPLSMPARRRILGTVTEWVVRLSPLRRRVRANLRRVWPDMAEAERRRLSHEVARNVGRTLASVWFNEDFAKETAVLDAHGDGLAALRAARAEGRGAILLSGHYGQWEAVRAILRREGIEAGAIYRPNNNPYYDPIFRRGLEAGGRPIVAKGRAGNRDLLRALRGGAVMAILPDQYVKGAPYLDFLGHPARTSLAAAELALRYDLPLIPTFAPEIDGRPVVTLEAPIPHTDAATMMQVFNDRLSSWVAQHPSQWYWLHRRWKSKGGRAAR